MCCIATEVTDRVYFISETTPVETTGKWIPLTKG